MNDKSASPQKSSPSTAAKDGWQAPTVEELDFASTETGIGAPGADGPYTS